MLSFNEKMNSPQEIKSLLACRIDQLRSDILQMQKTSSCVHLLKYYKELALYCFSNLEIPSSYVENIGAHLMGPELYQKGFDNEKAIKFIAYGGYVDIYGQNLNSPLKAVEVLLEFSRTPLNYTMMFYILNHIFKFYALIHIKDETME